MDRPFSIVSTEKLNLVAGTPVSSSIFAHAGTLRVVCTVDTHIKLNSNAGTSDYFLPAMQEVFLTFPANCFVSILADSAAGDAYVSEINFSAS